MLCRAFHCSRARLYRLFEPLGGIARHIRDRRLRRCFDQLALGGGKARQIHALAASCGFHDRSHFHRVFKARFQMTPSDALALGHASRDGPTGPSPPAPSAQLMRLHGWLRHL